MEIFLEKLNLLTHLNIIKKFRWISSNTIRRWKKLRKTPNKTVFFNQHSYFSEVWKYLGESQKNKILEIIAEGKGIIPYEKIVGMNSMFLSPENDVYFEKNEFYSNLKQKVVSDSDYESSIFLYKTLKMQNLGDMNDLYNAQDVILLCEIG